MPAEKIIPRMKKLKKQPEAIAALKAKILKVEELIKKWETTMPQVTEEERDCNSSCMNCGASILHDTSNHEKNADKQTKKGLEQDASLRGGNERDDEDI